ncbi:Asp-tRNA(Asn)/Glu-tRNA(Gln) amidotransferase subunit GatB [Algivirga pacifica]|uniref:Aspartyl/glutamyl-tRNA(Asn/Gln) amidotransferase subunit B n=1 Tax=Algivirga pacifica TaxID=1162670 RepID=A0ABP9DM91_9BACT
MDKAILDKYQLVVGLEVHAQLQTKSKAYASDSTEFGQLPNTNISVITLAHPGALPKINKTVVEYAIKMGLACHSDITRYNIYDRKNYFYPDLPKGYQVTQDKTPICDGGYVEVAPKNGERRKIRLNRIHMEEDAGKSMHLEGETETLVDLNRAGVALIEIVSEPDIRTSEEAYSFLTEVRKLVRYLDICDGNMEEGSLRCDANISVMLKGATEYGKKVEVKNMNSMRNVQRAIEHEMERQIEILENGGTIDSETRTFNAVDGSTAGMRSKESLNDYRYFPEPDLPPLIVEKEWVDTIRASMPSLPADLFKKFTEEFKLPEYDAQVLTDRKGVALFFEELCTKTSNYKAASNWVMGPVKSYLNELTLHMAQFPLSTDKIAELIHLVEDNKVSFAIASKQLFPKLIEHPERNAEELAKELDLIHESNDDAIIPMIEEVINKFPDKVAAYKAGKKNLLGMFMGEVMKMTKGKVDPKKANQLIREILEK